MNLPSLPKLNLNPQGGGLMNKALINNASAEKEKMDMKKAEEDFKVLVNKTKKVEHIEDLVISGVHHEMFLKVLQ